MIFTTTSTIEGHRITQYHGIVTGQAILGANVFTDLFASIRDVIGGRAGSYERVLRDARNEALNDLAEEARQIGANGVIGIDLDYETVGQNGSMLMVTATGTAVSVT